MCQSRGLAPLLQAWSESNRPVRCIVPEGAVLAAIAPGLRPGEFLSKNQLTIYAQAFAIQEDYDFLLWACDLNFARGEDSFVRAQWAARPCVWHIYPQDEEAHRVKLEAFLERYCEDLSAPATSACHTMWQTWNFGSANQELVGSAWAEFRQYLSEMTLHAKRWATQLAVQEDLASSLVRFSKKLI